MVNGSRAVGGNSCCWKQQLEQTNLHKSLHLWVILPLSRLSSSLLLVSATAANFQLPIDLCISIDCPTKPRLLFNHPCHYWPTCHMMSLVRPRKAWGLYNGYLQWRRNGGGGSGGWSPPPLYFWWSPHIFWSPKIL